MMLNFDETEYSRIPKPKRTWVMRVLRGALGELDKERFEAEEKEYVFEWENGMKVAKGVNPLDAMMSLGLSKQEAYKERDSLVRWAPKADAIKEGWYKDQEVPREASQVNPFDI